MKRPILVLCVDRDNDLFEKAKVSGPLIGREKNLDGATRLALSDPEDPDSNAIFYAIKIFDEMKKEGNEAEIVTLTGDKNLGFSADKEVSAQLDRVVREMSPSSCVLVSDGASDEELIPIINSRLKIDSTKIVFIKQAKELEKTYFVLLEKIRDPYYAKIFIGIPALLILLFSVSSLLGLGWQPAGIIVGSLLIIKGFGVDDIIVRAFKDLSFSVEKTSSVAFIGGYALLIVALLIGYQSFNEGRAMGLANEKLLSYVAGSVAYTTLFAFLIFVAGKAADAISEKRKFAVTRYALYMVVFILGFTVLKIATDWVVNINPPYVSFGGFLLTLAVCFLIGYASTKILWLIKRDILMNMKLEGKEAVNERGTYLGKIVGVDGKKENLIIQTIFERKYPMSFDSVSAIGENVVLKTGE